MRSSTLDSRSEPLLRAFERSLSIIGEWTSLLIPYEKIYVQNAGMHNRTGNQRASHCTSHPRPNAPRIPTLSYQATPHKQSAKLRLMPQTRRHRICCRILTARGKKMPRMKERTPGTCAMMVCLFLITECLVLTLFFTRQLHPFPDNDPCHRRETCGG